jgi:hypothetical protein
MPWTCAQDLHKICPPLPFRANLAQKGNSGLHPPLREKLVRLTQEESRSLVGWYLAVGTLLDSAQLRCAYAQTPPELLRQHQLLRPQPCAPGFAARLAPHWYHRWLLLPVFPGFPGDLSQGYRIRLPDPVPLFLCSNKLESGNQSRHARHERHMSEALLPRKLKPMSGNT